MNGDERTRLLLGDTKTEILTGANVLVVGLGGVGAWAAELLCRAGIGQMTIADGDVIEKSNLNRQLPAMISTLGKPKTEVVASRLLDINPALQLTVLQEYLRDDRTIEILKSRDFDYVVDCIDTLSPKTFLIFHAAKIGFRVVSSMGSGGKTDPMLVKIADISESHDCNLARMVRKKLHRLGIRSGIRVVFSPEEVHESAIRIEQGTNKLSTVGTISYMPAVFGCCMASVVIRDLLGTEGRGEQ